MSTQTTKQFLPEGGGGRIPIPVAPKTTTTTSKLIGSNPGLLTSTGGLQGTSGFLLTPAFNPITNASFFIGHDPTNFNCDEAAEYDFRQECAFPNIPYYEGRDVTIHQVILKYREIGIASFNVNITVFKKAIDDFETISIPVSIPAIPLSKASKTRKNNFPDGRIHTVRLAPPKGVVQGERPQITITSIANSGPYSITKLIICGNADEVAQA
jgi:hypothetical protein